MSKILLLDGNSLLYRGFFAMRVLTTSDGTPTNAIYSMTLMLLTALESQKPDAVVCAFDAPVATFRHEAYDEYKGTRQRTPDELAAQRPLARDLMRAFNIPILEIPGYEADDTIGTLAVLGQSEGHSVTIVTGDLDALQLVDDHGPIEVMTTVKGVSETVVYDEARVRERYGLSPKQIPDYKALKGDSSDNLPGVPGIGDKTATKILSRYQTIEHLIESLESIEDPKLRNLIASHSTNALRFKDLATIRRNVPLEGFAFDLDYQSNGINLAEVTRLFEKLEFRTLIKRLGSTTKREPPVDIPQRLAGFGKPPESATTGVQSSAMGVCLEFDVPVEKADFFANNLLTISISEADGAVTFPLSQLTEPAKAKLADANLPKIVHDGKLATGAFLEAGLQIDGIGFDTLLAAYLINPGRGSYKLSELIADNLGGEPGSSGDIARQIRELQPILLSRLEEAGLKQLLHEMEMPLSIILAKMERAGVAIDIVELGKASRDMAERIAALEQDIFRLAGGESFALGSTKQLQHILFEVLNLPAGKKTKTGYSTDSEVLEMLAAEGFEIGAKISQWRELSKLKSTYADNLQTLVSARDGRIHTSLNQTVTATGRLSSSNPNLQNIPVRTEVGREIRRCFIPGPGRLLLAADYSQIELRIFAHVTRDLELVRTFQADEDIHRKTASSIFQVDQRDVTSEMRRRAKTINFAVIYGMSDFRLATELGIDVATANAWKKRYFAEYPGVNEFASSVLASARERGYVETLFGRRRYTPDINSRVFQFRQAAEREAVNMPIQGTAADIMKRAMIDVDRALTASGLDAQMTLQVHDELVFECAPNDVRSLAWLVANAMENAYNLSIRLKVEVKCGYNWAEMTAIEDPLGREKTQAIV